MFVSQAHLIAALRRCTAFSQPGALMAMDVGDRRIGLAVTDAVRGAVRPLSVVERTRADPLAADPIARALHSHSVLAIVVGLPMNVAQYSNCSKQADKTLAFLDALNIALGGRKQLNQNDESNIESKADHSNSVIDSSSNNRNDQRNCTIDSSSDDGLEKSRVQKTPVLPILKQFVPGNGLPPVVLQNEAFSSRATESYLSYDRLRFSGIGPDRVKFGTKSKQNASKNSHHLLITNAPSEGLDAAVAARFLTQFLNAIR